MTSLGWGMCELKSGNVQSEFWFILGRGNRTIGVSYCQALHCILFMSAFYVTANFQAKEAAGILQQLELTFSCAGTGMHNLILMLL